MPISLNDVPKKYPEKEPNPIPEEQALPDLIVKIQATTVDPSLAVNAALLPEGGAE